MASATRHERHILQSSRCRGTCILTRRSPSSTGEVQVFGTWSCVRGRRSMSLLVLDSKTWRVGGLGSLVDNMTLAHNVMAMSTCTCTYNERSKQRTLPCLDTRWRLASPCTLWLYGLPSKACNSTYSTRIPGQFNSIHSLQTVGWKCNYWGPQ